MERTKGHVLLGDLDAAFLDLEQAERERSVWIPIETAYPYLAPLKADPRYDQLLERMGVR
jgi:hypothetical protein